MLPGFLGIVVFVLLPFGDVVRRSFTTAVTGQFNGIQNYRTVFENQAFLLAVKNTLNFTLVCIPLLVFSGFVAALLLNTLQNKRWIKSIYLFPLAMPTATIVLVWKMFFYRQGFLNLLLTRIGQQTGLWEQVCLDYLGTPAAFWVLVGSYIWKNMGYTVVLWLAGLMGIPKGLLEAARVDGAGHFYIWGKLMMPLVKPVMATVALINFKGAWSDFQGPLLYLSDKSKYTLQLGLQVFKGEGYTEWNYLMAVSFLSMIPILLLFFCFQNYFIEGMNVGGAVK